MAPSLIGGAAIPLAVFFLVRHHVHGDAPALAIAGVPAAAWIVVEFIRRRKIDPIGTLVFVGFLISLAISALLGGNAFVLKVRDAGFTLVFGIVCLLSLRIMPKPMIFYVGRALSAGDDPAKMAAYDAFWDEPPVKRMFAHLTILWGVGLFGDAVTRISMAALLPTATFVTVAPLVVAAFVGVMFFFTTRYVHRVRARVQAVSLALPGSAGTAV